ncbi:MAG: EI24 domain-containing protein [Myxococcota bacterium]|nr:EI24 domain-containing protein [Myxococcota bacterium]MDW8363471.1 EI24 domain-containing protein [Myxococcales bacterium]
MAATGSSGVVRGAAEAGRRTVVGFWRGARYPLAGARFVYLRHPGLVRIWIWPIVLTAALFATGAWLAWTRGDDIVQWLWTEPAGEGFWAGAARLLHGALTVLARLLLLLVALLVSVLLAPVLAAPFNDLLSEHVERLLRGRPGPPTTWRSVLRGLGRTVLLELVKVMLYLAIMIPLFVLSLLVPVLGQIVYSVFAFLFTAIYWAIDYVDWPASRADRGVRARFALVRRHFVTMLGFGTGVWLLLLVPLLNLLLMPAAVAGGTMLYLDLEEPVAERRA